jgi:flagellar motor switch protein FliN/FliY
MPSELTAALRLEVPVIVRLGERTMTVSEVTALTPGAIIELPKNADAELDLLVNNKQIGTGVAVKVGENFGLRIAYIGDVRTRIAALGGQDAAPEDGAESLADILPDPAPAGAAS